MNHKLLSFSLNEIVAPTHASNRGLAQWAPASSSGNIITYIVGLGGQKQQNDLQPGTVAKAGHPSRIRTPFISVKTLTPIRWGESFSPPSFWVSTLLWFFPIQSLSIQDLKNLSTTLLVSKAFGRRKLEYSHTLMMLSGIFIKSTQRLNPKDTNKWTLKRWFWVLFRTWTTWYS